MVKENIEKIVELPEGFTAEAQGSKLAIKGNGKEAQKEFKVHGISFKAQGKKRMTLGSYLTPCALHLMPFSFVYILLSNFRLQNLLSSGFNQTSLPPATNNKTRW